MKATKYLSLAALFLCFLSITAFSQTRSIKSVPEDAVYHSKDDGFNISLPADMVQRKNIDNAVRKGHNYAWEFSDAVILVGVENRTKPVKTDADVAAAVAEFKAKDLKDDKILSESPAKIGDYRGSVLVVDKGGPKALMVIVYYEKFGLLIAGLSDSKDPAISKLIADAIQSFEFVD